MIALFKSEQKTISISFPEIVSFNAFAWLIPFGDNSPGSQPVAFYASLSNVVPWTKYVILTLIIIFSSVNSCYVEKSIS